MVYLLRAVANSRRKACNGGAAPPPPMPKPLAPGAVDRALQSTGGPGTTSITYYDTFAPAGGPCDVTSSGS